MLKLWPAYIEPVLDVPEIITMQQLLNCSIGANPIEHLKTPTLLYVRGAKFDIWNAKARQQLTTKQSDILGRYALPGAKPPYRLQTLDIPSWILSCLREIQKSEFNSINGNRMSNSQTLDQLKKYFDQDKKGSSKKIGDMCKKLLDITAKTKYFNTYLMTKKATLTLAITQQTIDLDSQLGKVVYFQVPLQAAQLGKTGQAFYGRMQNINYTFTAANTPRAKSTMTITCQLSGVTSAESPAASIFTDDDPFFIYKRG